MKRHTMKLVVGSLLLTLLAACANVSTRVLELKPGAVYPAAASTQILFAAPKQPHTEIALIESEGQLGVGAVEVLEDLRRKAQALGADAVVVTDNQARYQPPVAVYDPWFYDPFFYRYRYRYLYPPYGPYGDFRVIDGGYYYVAKGLAIRYQDTGARPAAKKDAGGR